MDRLQKLQLRQSELKVQIGAMVDTETEKRGDTFAADLAKLTGEARSLETEVQAAILAQPDPEETRSEGGESKEEMERRALEESIGLERYIAASLAGHGVLGGPEAEYNQEIGLTSDQFPLELLTRGMDAEIEKRAAIDGDARTTQGSWVDRLFSDTAARRLGVTFPMVAPGVASYPVTTGGGTPRQRGRTEDTPTGTYSVAVTELKPTRNAVHGEYSIEDTARLPGLADAIVRDMRAGMTEKVDRAVFNGDTGANENSADITGFTTAGINEITLTQANKTKGLEWLKELAALIDGKYAASMEDINLVLTVGANTLLMSNRELAAVSDETVASFLRRNGINWGVRGSVETATGNGKFGAFVGLRRGIAGTAVAPIWSAASLVRDPYSKAKSGEVLLTLNYLWNFGIPRTDNYRRLKFVT